MMLDLAMGNDLISSNSYNWIKPNKSSPSSPRRSLRSIPQNSSGFTPVVKLVYIVALLSWMSALYLAGQTKQAYASMLPTVVAHKHQYELQRSSMRDIEYAINVARDSIEALEHTKTALEHELQVIQELHEAEIPVDATPEQELIGMWLHHRQEGLRQRMMYLQHHVQIFSKNQVLEQWGPGPHRVAFTVEYNNDQGSLQNRHFVVELASVDDMPHSVHFFLEMVNLKLWDHTVLLHHEKVEHLLAAVPIDFTNQQFKHAHLAYLGWTSLAFPEYHAKYEHAKYTIGFASNGPTWYFNTIDNTEAHGPGGIATKKLFQQDADPCFGRVIEGTDVVDDLIQFGLHQKQTDFEEGHPWNDEPHTWTHLVKLELMSS